VCSSDLEPIMTNKEKDMSNSAATGKGATSEPNHGAHYAASGKSTQPIRAHMDVIASCGTKIGVVDGVEGNAIKLTKNDSPDGSHHFISTKWVDHVDEHVHLNKNSKEAKQDWKADAASCERV